MFRKLRFDLPFQTLPDGRSPVAEVQPLRRGVCQPQSPAVQPLWAVQRQNLVSPAHIAHIRVPPISETTLRVA